MKLKRRVRREGEGVEGAVTRFRGQISHFLKNLCKLKYRLAKVCVSDWFVGCIINQLTKMCHNCELSLNYNSIRSKCLKKEKGEESDRTKKTEGWKVPIFSTLFKLFNVNKRINDLKEHNKNILNKLGSNYLKAKTTYIGKILNVKYNIPQNIKVRIGKIKSTYSITVGNIYEAVNLSTKIMILLTIFLLLICQGVEINPGPPNKTEIVTYNCNGLGDRQKRVRLLRKLDKKVNAGSIIFLQETHVVGTEHLKSCWKNKFISNGRKTNAAGVMLLFSNDYEVKYEYIDEEGRLIVAVLEKNEESFIVSNAYYPNDHKEGIIFAEKMYLKILETQAEFPDSVTICAGDYNVCMNPEDSLGRNGSQNEKLLADVLRNNNKVTGLSDAFRTIHKEGGYTWKRGNIYSRLDYIFISSHATPDIKSAKTDWAYESSDHAAVIICLINQQSERGPGIIKVNTQITEDPKVTEEISNEIKEMMNQVDESWNPHAILEFLKVTIRTVISTKVAEKRKATKTKLEETEEELDQMEKLKIKAYSNVTNITERLKSTEKAIETLKVKVGNLRRELNDKINFYSRAKWFEYGEKSNKYFLNLEKLKQKQKMINRIKSEDNEYIGQKQVSDGITSFYSELYSRRERKTCEDENYYKECPKLNEEQKCYMDNGVTLEELKNALSTCKDSAPGPDGIPYSIYKKFWNITGPIILKAWIHSVNIRKLPPSHLESAIILLPKEGKDISDIKNWRPITLSNCDAKIITKAMALRAAKVLDSIIDPSQTAYVPGRSITDNLRSNYFYKKYCKKTNTDAVLISLDAKKAFDSVNHKYIEETLEAYGFGPSFLEYFRILYKDITARIIINGFYSEKINIERGVKQGDALSCALFIICIDPLLRNINKNKEIREVKIIKAKARVENLKLKAAAYADDISVICEKTKKSIQMVFREYQRLTNRSGLELNADKTEILVLNSDQTEKLEITYNNKTFDLQTIRKMKICGLYFCTNENEEYKENVLNKIEKLSYKIKSWTTRHLTLEGKTLIVKTFGLSQIIYNMQAYDFKDPEIVQIERTIFKFLWSTNENQNGIDRIKRSIMKNEYSEGGMKVTDIECLNRSLKLRQFVRGFKANHVISDIQSYLTSKNGKFVTQEYSQITDEEAICMSAQETINMMTDYNRRHYEEMQEEQYQTDKNLIDEISSINLLEYLQRKKHLFLVCMIKPLTRNGITTLGELTQEYEHEKNRKMVQTMKIIISAFPKKLVEIARCFVEGINDSNEAMIYVPIDKNMRKNINVINTKEIQTIMKNALKKLTTTNFKEKLGIENFQEDNIIKLRSKCQNAKFRNLYFRLIHNDFYTHVRMKKYKMCQTDQCPRCGLVETSKHLLWECAHVQKIWNIYNQVIIDDQINTYEDIFKVSDSHSNIMIKMKTIQELIQIDRPKNWNRDTLIDKIKGLMNIEKHNAYNLKTIEKYNKKWKKYDNL